MRPVSGSRPHDTIDVSGEPEVDGPAQTGGTQPSARAGQATQAGKARGAVGADRPDAGNAVEAFNGPRAGAPGSGRTAEDHAFRNIEAALTRSWADWTIGPEDVATVQRELQGLSPESYREVLRRMDRARLLDRFIQEMSPEAVSDFVEQALSKGYLRRDPTKPAPAAPLNPPDRPGYIRDHNSLPSAVRAMLVDVNARIGHAYNRDYEAYLDRYVGAAMSATDLLDIRALGEPAAALSGSTWLDQSDWEGRELQKRWAGRVDGKDPRFRAYDAISNRMADLTGQQRAGTFWLNLAGEVKVENEAFSMRYGVDMQIAQYGAIRDRETAAIGGKAGAGRGEIRTDPNGGFVVKEGIEVSRGGVDVGAHFSGDGKLDAKLKVGGAGGSVSLGPDGSVAGELSLGPGPSANVKVNPDKATFEGGVSKSMKAELLGAKVELKSTIGVGFQGIAADRVQDIVQSNGVFSEIPELDQRIAWRDLPKDRRDFLTRNGWTEALWQAAIDR